MQQFFDTLTDDSGNALLGATVTVTAYPGGGAATIYSTNGTSSPIASSTVISDITGQINFYAPDGAYILTYAYKSTVYKTRSPVQILDPTDFVAILDTGAANAYVVTDQRLSTQLYVGMKVEIQIGAGNSNTGASTLNVNATGNQPVTLPGGTPVPAGTFAAGGLYRLEWDGTEWQVIGVSPSLIVAPSYSAAVLSGPNNVVLPSSSDQVLSVNTGAGNVTYTGFVAQRDGQKVTFYVNGANNLNITTLSGSSLAANQVTAEAPISVGTGGTITIQYSNGLGKWFLV